MKKEVDVAIIGAGSAGLYALSQVKKETDNFIIINDGPYGTTCARVGCMPSKSLIQIADYYHDRLHFEKSGIHNADQLEVSIPDVLQRVRKHRDILVNYNIKNSITTLGDKILSGKAEFIDTHTLKVGDNEIHAKKIIIATGSTPVYDTTWDNFREYILTTDELFEQNDLPPTLGVLGLGVIGLEIGQALARLGIKVTAINSKEFIGGLSDPDINKVMVSLCEKEFDMWLGGERASLEKVENKVKIRSGIREVLVDKVLISIGRKPNLKALKLENIGITLDQKGMPNFNPQTMQIEDLPIYMAGDVNADRPLLHEAADEGRIAGYNAIHAQKLFKRKVPLAIVFTDPNIAFIGKEYSEIKDDVSVLIGSYDFSKQARAMLMNVNKGIANLYVQKSDGKILGAQIAVPGAEHLAHHIAWAIEQNLTVYQMIKFPFYHPTLEEGLYLLLLDCIKKLGINKKGILEIPFLENK
ncbi:MAG TPA: dihydrolipoyl dehydrogenase [Sulfurovum sp.]|nr:dihydrolipoyl dehydrogenase [Sulfurovum sp.]